MQNIDPLYAEDARINCEINQQLNEVDVLDYYMNKKYLLMDVLVEGGATGTSSAATTRRCLDLTLRSTRRWMSASEPTIWVCFIQQ